MVMVIIMIDDDNDEEKLDASENCTSLPANLDAGYPLHAMTQQSFKFKRRSIIGTAIARWPGHRNHFQKNSESEMQNFS